MIRHIKWIQSSTSKSPLLTASDGGAISSQLILESQTDTKTLMVKCMTVLHRTKYPRYFEYYNSGQRSIC